MPEDLAGWLLARIAEDEAEVNSGPDYMLRKPSEGYVWIKNENNDEDLQASAARVLAECDSKRRIIEWVAKYADSYDTECGGDLSRSVLTRLALPYADHPDYRDEWSTSDS